MCLSIVAKIEKILENGEAIVDLRNVRKKININFISDPKVGEWILIHTGFAIAKLDEEKANEILSAYEQTENMDLSIL